jgi:integrase/recombinase XerD
MTALATDYRTKNSLHNLQTETAEIKTLPATTIENCVTQRKNLNFVLSELLEKDYSENSRKAMSQDINCFLRWYENINQELFSFKRLIPRDFREFRIYLQQTNRSVATINRRLISLRNLCQTAVEFHYLTKNPVSNIKLLAQMSLAPKGLTTPQARKFRRETEILGSLRDRVILNLMLDAGLRASEVVSLRTQDIVISERKGTAKIANAKGNKTRVVPLNCNLRMLLSEFLSETKPTDYLFHGQRGRLTKLAVTKIVQKYARRAELKMSPHTLRHTFAYRYLQVNAGDLVGLSQILGHSNINTTAIYTQNRMVDLQEKVEKL